VYIPQGSLRQIIRNLEELHPGLWNEIMDQDEDRIKPELAVAIDGETNHFGLIQQIEETSEIHFIPAISGGS
jgi:molybdopterin converting factor small subunit